MWTAAFTPNFGSVVVSGPNIDHGGATSVLLTAMLDGLLPCRKWSIPSRHSAQVLRCSSGLVDPGDRVVGEQGNPSPTVERGLKEAVKGESGG
jgi:hypothetical protein